MNVIEFLSDFLYYSAVAASYLLVMCFGAVLVFVLIGLLTGVIKGWLDA